MSAKFKESTQWYEFYLRRKGHRAKAIRLLQERDQIYRLVLTFMNETM